MNGGATGKRPLRRLISVDDSEGRSRALSDGFVDDVMLDAACPGFCSARVWVTDSTPAIARPMQRRARMPHTLEPPTGGSIFRIVTIPPDSAWNSRCSNESVRA